jgi:hypothetical protein
MPFFSVSMRCARPLRTRFLPVQLILVCLLLPTAARAQVTYTGSGAVNFASQAIGAVGASQTLTFSIGVLTTGKANLDFTDATGTTCTATMYSSTTSCQVNVAFKPPVAGPRMGAVVFFSGTSNTGTVLASVPVYGIGIGPQIAYGPGTQTAFTFPASGNAIYAYTIAVDAAGDLFLAGYSGVIELAAGGKAMTIIDPTVNGLGLNGPGGVAVNGAGDLFIADFFNNRVVEVPVGGGPPIAIDPSVNGFETDWTRRYGRRCSGRSVHRG